MIPNSYPGVFIDIEGLDGSGSSTQLKMAGEWLAKSNKKVFETKEPTNNVIGGLIRGALTNTLNLPLDSLQLLFAADRAHHLHREIIPMLQAGSVVLTDRYVWSTVAFGAIELDKEWLLTLNEHFLMPDITIFVQVSPQECVRRIKKSRFDVELFEEAQKLTKVWEGYTWLAAKFKEVHVVNGERPVEVVFGEIKTLIGSSPKFKTQAGKTDS